MLSGTGWLKFPYSSMLRRQKTSLRLHVCRALALCPLLSAPTCSCLNSRCLHRPSSHLTENHCNPVGQVVSHEPGTQVSARLPAACRALHRQVLLLPYSAGSDMFNLPSVLWRRESSFWGRSTSAQERSAHPVVPFKKQLFSQPGSSCVTLMSFLYSVSLLVLCLMFTFLFYDFCEKRYINKCN